MWPEIRTSHSFCEKASHCFATSHKKTWHERYTEQELFPSDRDDTLKKQTCYFLTLQKLLRFTFRVAQALPTEPHEKMNFWTDCHWQNKNKLLLEIQYRLYFIEFLGNSISYRLWLFSNDPTCEPGYFAMCI